MYAKPMPPNPSPVHHRQTSLNQFRRWYKKVLSGDSSAHSSRVVGKFPVYGVFGMVVGTNFLFVKCVRSLCEQA